jgi:hypothetical protein
MGLSSQYGNIGLNQKGNGFMKIKKMDIVLLVLSIVLCAGIKLIFHACAPKEDGGWMACHWAEQAIFANGVILVLSAILRLFVKSSYKTGIAMAMTATAGITLLIPNVMIKLCMMKEMRCHSVMHPAVMVICILLVIACVADIWVHFTKEVNPSGGGKTA